MHSKNLKLLFALLGGAAAGATLAVLFAPDKGEKYRNRMVDEVDKLRNSVKDKFSALAGAADELSASVKSSIKN